MDGSRGGAAVTMPPKKAQALLHVHVTDMVLTNSGRRWFLPGRVGAPGGSDVALQCGVATGFRSPVCAKAACRARQRFRRSGAAGQGCWQRDSCEHGRCERRRADVPARVLGA